MYIVTARVARATNKMIEKRRAFVSHEPSPRVSIKMAVRRPRFVSRNQRILSRIVRDVYPGYTRIVQSHQLSRVARAKSEGTDDVRFCNELQLEGGYVPFALAHNNVPFFSISRFTLLLLPTGIANDRGG